MNRAAFLGRLFLPAAGVGAAYAAKKLDPTGEPEEEKHVILSNVTVNASNGSPGIVIGRDKNVAVIGSTVRTS